ncbi:hypothetical protein ABPG72_016106 [Tetrahymena utriculariae]
MIFHKNNTKDQLEYSTLETVLNKPNYQSLIKQDPLNSISQRDFFNPFKLAHKPSIKQAQTYMSKYAKIEIQADEISPIYSKRLQSYQTDIGLNIQNNGKKYSFQQSNFRIRSHKFVWLCFFIIILILSIVNYTILNNAYIEQQNEVLNLDWPQQIQNALQQEVVDLTFQKLTEDQYFFNNLFQSNEKLVFMPSLKAQQKNQLKLLKNYILKHLLITYPSQDVDNLILSDRIYYLFETQMNQCQNIDSRSIQRIEHIVYFMLQSIFAIQTFDKQIKGRNDALIIDNFENFQLSYTNIQYTMEHAIQQKFDSLLNHAELIFYNALSFSIIFFIFFQ